MISRSACALHCVRSSSLNLMTFGRASNQWHLSCTMSASADDGKRQTEETQNGSVSADHAALFLVSCWACLTRVQVPLLDGQPSPTFKVKSHHCALPHTHGILRNFQVFNTVLVPSDLVLAPRMQCGYCGALTLPEPPDISRHKRPRQPLYASE